MAAVSPVTHMTTRRLKPATLAGEAGNGLPQTKTNGWNREGSEGNPRLGSATGNARLQHLG